MKQNFSRLVLSRKFTCLFPNIISKNNFKAVVIRHLVFVIVFLTFVFIFSEKINKIIRAVFRKIHFFYFSHLQKSGETAKRDDIG